MITKVVSGGQTGADIAALNVALLHGFPHGGSLRTIDFARKHKKPCLHLSRATDAPAIRLREFVAANGIIVMNVAGSRESKEPGIHAWVMSVLDEAFFPARR